MVVTLRSRYRTLEPPSNPKRFHDQNPSKANKNEDVSRYEQSREERIKQNLQRMQKLGILDLSQKLKSFKTPKTIQRIKHEKKPPLNSSLPTRRSSRLQSLTPVCYFNKSKSKKEKELLTEKKMKRRKRKRKWGDEKDWVAKGVKPEIYGEEHEKLLGTCEESWILHVDGYDAAGNRIDDPINGKRCHQCRQKTIGHLTHCSNCKRFQSQFCGDCLYMRYGENVLEANKNLKWVCPICRGICNCSFCRIKRGWAPVRGDLYEQVSHHGYKSVAHFLIQTRRSQANSDDLVPAKRSRSFTAAEETKASMDSVAGRLRKRRGTS